MTVTIDSLVTPGEIARTLNQPLHRIQHILQTRAHIRPVQRVGIVRAYAAEVIEDVRREIEAIDAKRAGNSAG